MPTTTYKERNMGRSRTTIYRIEFTSVYSVSQGGYWHWSSACWDGRASSERLAQHVRDLEASTLPGGCNAHLGVTRILGAQLVHQGTGEAVAKYAPAMFEVVA